MWVVEYVKSAEREFLALPRSVRLRVAAKVVALAGNPFPRGYIKLEGHTDYYRVRCGDYRVVYQLDRAHRRISVMYVRDRKGVYRGL